MRGLAAGQEAFVDPTDPFIVMCLSRGLLVSLERQPDVVPDPAPVQQPELVYVEADLDEEPDEPTPDVPSETPQSPPYL